VKNIEQRIPKWRWLEVGYKCLPKPKVLLGTALLGGILMGLTPAPVGAWPLAWISLAPLWILIINHTKYPRENSGFKDNFPALIGCLWGIGYNGLALFWITGIHPMKWMGVPWLWSLTIALLCWTVVTLWGAVLVAVWAKAMSLIGSTTTRGWVRIMVGVALWCALESFWNLGPLVWTSLSYTQSPHNLVILHLSQLSGFNAVTAAIVAVNGLMAEAWINRANAQKNPDPSSFSGLWLFNCKYLHLAVGLLVGLHLIGFTLYSRPLMESPQTGLKVGIIQGNIPNEIKLSLQGKYRALDVYTRGYEFLANQGADAILTPEVALPFLWENPGANSNKFYQAVIEKGVVVWLGGYGTGKIREGLPHALTTSLFTLTGKGEIFSRYDKVHLVPLGESLPFEKTLGRLRLSPNKSLMLAGESHQVFDTPFGRAIVGICFDSAFTEHFRSQAAAGGEFILTASNDAHYSPAMPAQHHAQDVMRAIETNRWAVRATNTGYSAIVDPHGRTQWLSGLNTYEVHLGTIYRRQNLTFYLLWSDWLTPVLFVSSASALLIDSFWRWD
jgi:apolipoprotein N-acyltransferase